MTITIETRFSFSTEGTADALLQFTAADIPEQQVANCHCRMSEVEYRANIHAQDDIGERTWVRVNGDFEVEYRAEVNVNRILAEIAKLEMLDPSELPAEAVQYLFDSRYCPASRLQSFIDVEFGHLSGGARIMEMREWIANRLRYVPGSSDSSTTAIDTFVERRGVCRDYAHLLVSMARASAIPARFCSVYAPGVDPPDFHAVAEVFLADPAIAGGGAWHIVDATRMADPASTVKIGVGRDAADVSFLTSFGEVRFRDKMIAVS